jgi:predicted phosphodiesterase
MAFFFTGDTHISHDISKLNTKNFPEQKVLTKEDYIIICGDFGGVWSGGKDDQYWLNWLDTRNFTTLFVDGNHENFALLNEYPVETFCGGKVHKLMPSVLHLMRGEIYEIDGKKFFAMGGAASHDMHLRTEFKNWWREEMPSEEEYDNAINNLAYHNGNIDYVISHCCPDSIQEKISPIYEHNRLTNFLEHIVKADCTYSKWFFGHYHEDIEIDEKHVCLYDNIVKL